MNFRHLTASVTSVAGLVIVAQSRLQIQLELSLSMLTTRHSLQLWGYAESQNARGSVTATGLQSTVEHPGTTLPLKDIRRHSTESTS